MFLLILRKEEGEEKEIFYANWFKMSINHWSHIPHAQEYFLDRCFFFFSFPEETGPKSISDLPYYLWLSKVFTASLSSFSRLHSSSVWLSKANESSWWWRTILWNGAVFRRTKKRKLHGEGGKEEESLKKEEHALGRESWNLFSHFVTIVELVPWQRCEWESVPCRQTERVHGTA